MSNLNYFTADLYQPGVMLQTDIQCIPFKENQFDLILCSHVLNHPEDDKEAMREMFRVLKPGGSVIIIVVIDNSMKETLEVSVTATTEERTRIFGFPDYLRRYGRDFKDRLKQTGFEVEIEEHAKNMEYALAMKYGLLLDDEIFFCTKPL